MIAGGCGGSSGKASAQTGFSLASIKGGYAGIFNGKVPSGSGLVPFNGTGIFIADGKGNLGGNETYNVNGTPCAATLQGTYTVNPDGIGTDAVTFTATGAGCISGSYTQSLAIAQSGDLVLLANTNVDLVTEEWHKQH